MKFAVTTIFLLTITLFHQNFGFKTKITIQEKKEIFISEFDQQTIEDNDGDIPGPKYEIENDGWVCKYFQIALLVTVSTQIERHSWLEHHFE